MSGISAREVADDLATDLTRLARAGCCADRRKPCEYHAGWGDGLDNFCRMFFSSEPIR